MYIYEIPFDTDKELCRLLDNDDLWRDLAGSHMGYSPFEINEMEQTARRQGVSPTSQLLTRWGQLNHRVEELFVLLYRMRHRPAVNCIKPLVLEWYQNLPSRRGTRNGGRERPTANIDENGNRQLHSNSIPLPVLLFEQSQLATSSNAMSEVDSANDRSSTEGNTSATDNAPSHSQNDDDDLFRRHVSAIQCLKYEELKEATGNWSETNLLGKGGFGQVYKGDWKHTTVAVKRLRDIHGKKELIQEMCLNQYRHDNILPLYGYSLGGPEACLVYQLMSGGSLEDRLRCRTHHSPLTWPQRHKILHGVARGLLFLHTMTVTPLIHGDIKPANILLDQCTVPRIGDFGLARKGPYGEDRTHVKVSKVHGTRPYLPDEYLRSRCLSPAVDVFSFGVVALEVATALRALDPQRHHPLLAQHAHHCELTEDRMIIGTQHSNPYLCREVLAIGIHCTEYNRQQRPTMLDVFKRLDALNFPGKDTL